MTERRFIGFVISLIASLALMTGQAAQEKRENDKSSVQRYEHNNKSPENSAGQSPQNRQPVSHTFLKESQAERLLGQPIKNHEGETVGKVNDLAIDLENGRIAFAIIGTGGILGVGEKNIAVGPRELKASSEDHLTVTMTKDSLKTMPAFDMEEFEQRAMVGQSGKIYGNQRGDAQDYRFSRLAKATDLIGMTIKNRGDQDLGEIEDMALNLSAGTVSAVYLGSGEVFDVEGGWVAVAPEDFSFQRNRDGANQWILDISEREFEQRTAFNEQDWQQHTQPEVSTTVAGRYDRQQRFTQERMGRFGRDQRDEQPTRSRREFTRSEEPYGRFDSSNSSWEDRQSHYDHSNRSDRQTSGSTKIIGKEVRDYRGEKIGDIRNLEVDLSSGRVTYVLISVGGVMGIGEEQVRVSLQELNRVPGSDSLRVNLSQRELRNRGRRVREENHPDPERNWRDTGAYTRERRNNRDDRFDRYQYDQERSYEPRSGSSYDNRYDRD